jgi:glucose-1-phosphate thymidylyltransferase
MKLDEILASFREGAMVFGYPVKDPERYGVIEFDARGEALSIEEKPKAPKSHYAVPGLYIYDGKVCENARSLKPSPRGELEITDLNNLYLRQGRLKVSVLGRGIAWLDTGTHASLLEASSFIYTVEARQGSKIACLEEIAYLRGFIDAAGLRKVLQAMPKSPYREYLAQRFPEVGA